MVCPSRPVQAAAALDHYPARQVDRLVLHQSSPDHSLSSPEHSGRDAGPRPKAEGLSASLGLQRPETSRGRLARAPNAPQRELESPTREELSWKTRRTLSGEGKRDEVEEEDEEIGKLRKKEEQEDERRKMEEEERDEEEEGRERRNEEIAMERRNLDREVEEERTRCSLEKERRLRLYQEELRKEEEEEERRLKKDSEERVR